MHQLAKVYIWFQNNLLVHYTDNISILIASSLQITDMTMNSSIHSKPMTILRRMPSAQPTTAPLYDPIAISTSFGYKYMDTDMDLNQAVEKALKLTNVVVEQPPMKSSFPTHSPLSPIPAPSIEQQKYEQEQKLQQQMQQLQELQQKVQQLQSSLPSGNINSNVNNNPLIASTSIDSNLISAAPISPSSQLAKTDKSREDLAKGLITKANISNALDLSRENIPNLRQEMPLIIPKIGNGPSSSLSNLLPSTCQTKKKIIVDVNRCGLGNRMVSLVSTILMALIMDRSVELDWVKNRYCAASYSELFHSKSQDTLPHNFRPFMYNVDEKYPASQEKEESVCQIYFDQSLNYTHLSFLSEKALFDRLNAECTVIKIRANIYFSHLLLNDVIGSKLLQTFHSSSPFQHISQIVFRPGLFLSYLFNISYPSCFQILTIY